MAIFDLALVGGTIVNHDSLAVADIAVDNGKVAAVARPGSGIEARETIDVSGKLVFPGGIDPHAHVTNLRPLEKFVQRETASLALGGITSLIDFLSTEDSYHDLAPQAISAIESSAYMDVGMHCVIQNQTHIDELESYAETQGITSFKMYMGAGDWRLYPSTVGIHDGLVYRTLLKTAKLGPNVQAMIHAENWQIAVSMTETLKAEGRTDPAAWTESRPNLCEVDCLQRIAGMARSADCPIYAVHLSTAEAPEILRTARGAGVDFTGETCPHYLMIHKDHPLATVSKYNPAIKAAADNEALWEAVADGTLDCMGSDHIPVRMTDKREGADNIWTARGGVPGSGTIMPLLFSEGMHKRGIAPERVAAVTSYNAARIFGLYPQKGHIAPGADADFVVSDPNRKVTVTPDLLDLDFTLFDGQEFTGWPEITLLRGEVIARDSELVGNPGQGHYLRRSL